MVLYVGLKTHKTHCTCGFRAFSCRHVGYIAKIISKITTQIEGGIKLPRICFVADYQNRKGDWRMLAYNGLVVLEVNDLQTYEEAVEIRELAKKLPETLMCFLGGSGRSVKIVCRGELFEGGLPKGEKDIRQFHLNLYNTARMAYQNQFGFDIQFLEPRLDRTVYMSADPEMGYRADARPFYADTNEHTLPQPVTISDVQFNFTSKRTTKHMEYWLIEK